MYHCLQNKRLVLERKIVSLSKMNKILLFLLVTLILDIVSRQYIEPEHNEVYLKPIFDIIQLLKMNKLVLPGGADTFLRSAPIHSEKILRRLLLQRHPSNGMSWGVANHLLNP